MPATITLKNIPDAIHLALTRAAKNNHRSLNCEIIAKLEASLRSEIGQVQGHVDRANFLCQHLDKARCNEAETIDIVSVIRADRNRR